jgi:anti-sigma B factor antagonist
MKGLSLKHIVNQAQFLTERENGPCHATLKLKGEIDLLSSPALRHELSYAVEESTSDLHLDLSGVSHLDSVGAAILVGTWKRLQQSGRSLLIESASPQVKRTLGLLKLNILLPPGLEGRRALA